MVGAKVSEPARSLPALGLLALIATSGCGAPDHSEPPRPRDGEAGVRASASVSPRCSPAKLAELLAPASAAKPSVELPCRAALDDPKIEITKRVIFRGAAASGAALDCGGATLRPTAGNSPVALQVLSRQRADLSWERPEGVTVRNCRVLGHLTVMGMAPNGVSPGSLDSSHQLGHTQRAQDAAPKGTRLQDLDIRAQGHIPLYIGPGATYTEVLRCRFSGDSDSVAIYLDAESAYSTLRGNDIRVHSSSRELLAVDGSAHNRILANRFDSIDRAAILLYRNCGEGGAVRHQAPQFNEIIGNIFEYRRDRWLAPAIWLASRNGFRGYCGADSGYPFGSSADDRDFAQYNLIAENQLVYRKPQTVILQNAEPNFFVANRNVRAGSSRPLGCPLWQGSTLVAYLRSGQSFSLPDPARPLRGTRYHCEDYVLSAAPLWGSERVRVKEPGLPLQRVP